MLRLLQITDTHLSAGSVDRLLGFDTGRSFDAVMDLACERFGRPDAVLATGDLSHDGSAASYRTLAAGLHRIGAPVYWVPGNHDVEPVAAAVLNDAGLRSERRFVRGRWQVILLDSAVAGRVHGRLSGRELERLATSLEALPDHHALVCLHHQPVDVGSRWIDALGLENGAALMDLLARYPQVRAVLWGHVHQEFRVRVNGVELMASPSTCIQFRVGSREFALEDRAPGFRWLELADDGTVSTGVARLEHFPVTVDLSAVGY